jgi:hypothetical protein
MLMSPLRVAVEPRSVLLTTPRPLSFFLRFEKQCKSLGIFISKTVALIINFAVFIVIF